MLYQYKYYNFRSTCVCVHNNNNIPFARFFAAAKTCRINIKIIINYNMRENATYKIL